MPTHHPEYTLHLLLTHHPTPLFIHVFLSPTFPPRDEAIDFSLPIDTAKVPEWVGQVYVMPSGGGDSGYGSIAMPRERGDGERETENGDRGKEEEDAEEAEKAREKAEGGVTGQAYTESPTTYHHCSHHHPHREEHPTNGHTPAFKPKTRTALPLTTPLLRRLPDLYTLPTREVREYLGKNLHLVFVKEDIEHRGEVLPSDEAKQLARAWVVRQEIDEGVWGGGRVRGSEVVWGEGLGK